jgi:heme exporter protein A
VFAGLDFAVAPGGCLVLTGRNGAGKSSLLRLMAGLLAPLAGVMQWNGARLDADPDRHRTRLHYVGHQDAIKAALSVREMLAFWARLRTGSDDLVDSALERFDIWHLRHVPGRYLSAGQRRRLALARLAAAPAPLWLLDEPTVSLDAEGVAGLEALIAHHRHQGGLVVLSTHVELRLGQHDALDLSEFGIDPGADLDISPWQSAPSAAADHAGAAG